MGTRNLDLRIQASEIKIYRIRIIPSSYSKNSIRIIRQPTLRLDVIRIKNLRNQHVIIQYVRIKNNTNVYFSKDFQLTNKTNKTKKNKKKMIIAKNFILFYPSYSL